MARIFVKNWSEFQHYRDRNPSWIKLHKRLLDDFVFHRLPLASRALAPMIWLLASESSDGSLLYDLEQIAFRLRSSAAEIEEAVKPLINHGFLYMEQDASNSLAEPERGASLEKRRERDREDSADAPKVDLKAELFGACLTWMASLNGRDPTKYRSKMGQWVRDYGEDRVLQAFNRARKIDKPVGDPVAWMERFINPPRKVPQI